MRKLIVFAAAIPMWAQGPLSLSEAVRLGLGQNKAVAGAGAGVRAAEARVEQARGGLLPKVNYSESFTRGNNPVYVFGSLLTQREFGPDNFSIGSLNRPDALNNFQSVLTVDQPLYDAGQTRNARQSANLGRQMTEEEQRRVQMEVIAGVTRAYYGAVLAAENLKTAEQAQRSAEADLKRAESLRAAGMSTDADVLSIRVHLAAVGERRINAAADLDVARAALNDALGLPLDTAHTLTTALAPLPRPEPPLEELEKGASGARPETRQASLAASLARTQVAAARSSLFPQIGFRAALEADRQRFVTRAGADWMAGVSLKWNLFNGFADKARIAEAGHSLARAEADRDRADSAVRLQVRRAWAGLSAAGQRIEVASASVAEAGESLRITQNRYEAGMANVTDLLRNETAVLESRTRYLAAVHDQRVAAAMLEYAAGRLSADSEVLQ